MIAEMILLACSLAPVPKVLAKSCLEGRNNCQFLLVEGKDIKLSYSTDYGNASVIGPYLESLQKLVAPTEAPTQEISLKSGWKIVITRGFDETYRMPGPIHNVYFVDRSGQTRLRSSGDLALEQIKSADLFGTGEDVVVSTMRGETGISWVTWAWILPREGAAREALFTDGDLLQLLRASARPGPSIVLG